MKKSCLELSDFCTHSSHRDRFGITFKIIILCVLLRVESVSCVTDVMWCFLADLNVKR